MNSEVLNKLEDATKIVDIPARLLSEDGTVLYTFLYNPEQKIYSRNVNYSAAPTLLSSIQEQEYGYTTGRELKLDNLLLESYGSGKSLRSLLEGIEALAVADVSKGQYRPARLYFSWGTELFGLCVISGSISWTETLWLGGEPAEARLSFTLVEVPTDKDKKITVPVSQTYEAQQTQAKVDSAINSLQGIVAETNPIQKNNISLTGRQRSEGAKAADAWVKANLSKLPTSIKHAYRQKKYSIVLNSAGEAEFRDSKTTKLKDIGVYDGYVFNGVL